MTMSCPLMLMSTATATSADVGDLTICAPRIHLPFNIRFYVTPKADRGKIPLKPLATRDAAAGDMIDCFDFHQKPLQPDVITAETKLDFSNMKATLP